ncbi:MAG: endonuclease/exonuclease/phosphatase family protein [Prevotella sp.]|nr:endonuclease/exonuclease/phosphatase family protein [Prevotella sp.]
MKKVTFTLLMLAVATAVSAQSLFVGTYNVRNQNDDDQREGNGWPQRVSVICDMINFEQPDIFGTQEAKIGQVRDMLRLLDGYDYIGVAREDGKEDGEHSAIFFKKDYLQLLDHGDFWLSETPDRPGLGWDAACVRICTWGKFRDKRTKMKFYYFNLHMDHVGVVARREGAKLVVKKIQELTDGKTPVILTGDFNVDQNDEIYTIFTNSGLLNDSYAVAKQRFCENGTFNAFKPDLKTQSRIDHIFLSPKFEVNHYGVLTNCYWTPSADKEQLKGKDAPQEIRFQRYERRLPSDHYLVLAKIHYKK